MTTSCRKMPVASVGSFGFYLVVIYGIILGLRGRRYVEFDLQVFNYLTMSMIIILYPAYALSARY